MTEDLKQGAEFCSLQDSTAAKRRASYPRKGREHFTGCCGGLDIFVLYKICRFEGHFRGQGYFWNANSIELHVACFDIFNSLERSISRKTRTFVHKCFV